MLNETVMSQDSPSMAVYSHAAALAAGGFQADREEQTSAPVLERPVFERLLFAQCWEDPRMDAESLCMQPGKTALRDLGRLYCPVPGSSGTGADLRYRPECCAKSPALAEDRGGEISFSF